MAYCKTFLGIVGLVCLLMASTRALPSGTTHAAKAPVSEQKENDEHEAVEEVLPQTPEYRYSSSYKELPQGENQPWRMMRKLQRAQDQIIIGSSDALENYRKMLFDYSTKMLKFQGEIWSHERNLDAVAIYVLVGGNPEAGKIALERSNLGMAEKFPLKAAMAFSEHNIDEAYRMLSAIEPTVLPPSLAGQFALARAMVTSSIDLDMTTDYLNVARRLAPGTLIEEASLRRLLRISGRQKDFEMFRFISSTYMRRFQRSHYLNDFLKSYAFGIARMPLEYQNESLKELQELVEMLEKRSGLFVLTFVARNGTIQARTKLARWAANEELGKLRAGSKLHTRMKLYVAASGIVDEEFAEEAVEMLEQIDSGVFDASDKKLFDAVTALSKRIMGAFLDTDQLVTILKNDQQTFPGENPKMPIELLKQVEFLRSNKHVTRFESLSKNYDTIMSEINQ